MSISDIPIRVQDVIRVAYDMVSSEHIRVLDLVTVEILCYEAVELTVYQSRLKC